MATYQAPGVYVEEVDRGPVPIEGVGTSTAGFLGPTERGPTDPELITSFAGFQRKFGSGIPSNVEESYLLYAVEGFFRNGGSSCYIASITAEDAAPAEASLGTAMDIEALGPGEWGNNVRIELADATLYDEDTNELFQITVKYWSAGIPGENEEAEEEPIEEIYDNLSPTESSSRYYEKRINGVSNFIEVTRGSDGGRPTIETEPTDLTGGSDGTDDLGISDYTGERETPDPPGERTGLNAFKEIDDIAIVCAPDEVLTELAGLDQKLVEHCQEMKDRFAVLQAKEGEKLTDLADGLDSTKVSEKGYAAFYYPWIKIRDPFTNVEKLVPPGGHVAGIYARSDEERGVHKAPANEQVRGVQELEFTITKDDQKNLNPKGINCIRSFRGRGILVWGARTTSRSSLWKYVNVRRLFLYLEESIDEGTQWVVFEPNDERLWARVRQSVSNFLTTAWRDGALMGTTPEEAFYVKCDRSTMTQDDIDNGRLICEIGVAPVKPAEFVIFRISQWTGGAEGA